MAHHITEPTELFPHLESRDLHVVQEVKALIQDHLYSGARDYSFQNALVEFYIRTNSQHAMDILCKVREPLDKPLVEKLNDCLKTGAKLESLTLLSHIVRRQPSWLYKIVQTNLYASLLQCLKTSCECPVIMCGLFTIATLLPMIPSLIGPSLNDIFEIFSRFVEWNLQRPGNVPEVYHLHIQSGVYALFHRLYGMFPWNFIEFLRNHYATRPQDFNATIQPMLERVRLHPQLILGSRKIETEAARWRKMEVHDVLTECSRVSLDITESARDDLSLYNISVGSESGRASSGLSSVINQARRTSSPLDSSRGLHEQKQKHMLHQRPHRVGPEASSLSQLDPSAVIWSPSVFCGLTTPPSSKPGSPGGSMLDCSFNSSLHLISNTNTPTPLNTPRDSPGLSNLTDDLKATGITETPNQAGRSSSTTKLKAKAPPALRGMPLAHKTVSAPSTPGYADSKPLSPARKHSGAGVAKCFNFELESGRAVRSQPKCTNTRSRESSGDSNEGQGSTEQQEGRKSMVTMKDLPHVIRGLSGNQLTTSREDDLAVTSELSAIATSSASLKQESEIQRGIPSVKDVSGHSLPFKVDFMLSEIPCEKLKGHLQKKKEELLAEVDGDIDENEITVLLEEFCWHLIHDNRTSEWTDQEKSSPIPVPKSENKGTHCEVCSSSGKSIEVTQVTGDNTPLSNTGRFTPIRDQLSDTFKHTEVTPDLRPSSGSHVLTDTAPYAHLFPYALTQSWPLQRDGATIDSSLEFSQGSVVFGTPQMTSRGSSVMGGLLSSIATFSPNELLDRHIQLGDTVHTKELSMLPLTSQTSVNWTHFGGAAPADEVNILKNQVIFLHNQVLYERHKREVHAERNRRLLGKTHKAKACQELNEAMKDQIKLQDCKISELKRKSDLMQVENHRLLEDVTKKETFYDELVKKLENDNLNLRECNQELQKLLVAHKEEVDHVQQNLQQTSADLFNTEQELQNARTELGMTKRLKDEITWLNKELLLLGEVNQKLREKIIEDQLGVRASEEHILMELAMKKELNTLKDTLTEKVIQLNAAKTRITELEAGLTNKDVAISEQKRFLETVKSLSKGRTEAIETKYNAQKKINQRLEAKILTMTKTLNELTGKDIFKPRPYQRSTSAQISESLRRNEASEVPVSSDIRASWHVQDWGSRESTPVKSQISSVSSLSPVESQSPAASLTTSPLPESGPLKSPSERPRATSLTQIVDKPSMDIAPPGSRINFSQSSPFQRVRSSHSDPSGNGLKLSKCSMDHESKSWAYAGEEHKQFGDSGGGGSLETSPVVVELCEGKMALVEDEASHVGDESLASILEMDLSAEVRLDQES